MSKPAVEKATRRWEGPPAKAISFAAIQRCTVTSLAPGHYRPDNTCMCYPPANENLEPHLIRGTN